jgi:hypothetical protein
MNTEQITQLATYFKSLFDIEFNKKQDCCYTYCSYHMPINKINDCNVDCRITAHISKEITDGLISTKHHLSFKIETANYLCNSGDCSNIGLFKLDSDKIETLTLEYWIEYLSKIYDILPKLKLDKLNGTLTSTDIIQCTDVLTLFITHQNIESTSCCVCLDVCSKKAKTQCNHILCVGCFTNLRQSDDNNNAIKCPMCREDIGF